ncbi:MAG: hypothetical protein M0Z53_00825, partial [Thermaerobacter sp.]|nr:hypothetical protein [Thermaerobacter sp.]
MTWLWLPTSLPNLNLIARLGKFVKPDELCSEYGWCLHGRSYPKFGPFNQAISECVADTSGRHPAQF